MTYAQINRPRPVAWWAIFGAPLVGVPMVVGLLALVTPERQSAGEEQDAEFAVEQVDIDTVGLTPGVRGGPLALPSPAKS